MTPNHRKVPSFTKDEPLKTEPIAHEENAP
jgi:hypothetical protein